MSKILINKILRFQRAVGAVPWLSAGVCIGAILLAGAAAPARADTFGICDSEGAFGTSISNASYASSNSTLCTPGLTSSLGPGGTVSPTSLATGLTAATLTVKQTMPFGGLSVSTSTASLNKGTLGVYADTQGGTGGCGFNCVGTGGRSTPEALFNDTLHFNFNGLVTLTAHLDGSIQSQGLNTFGYTLQEQFGIGGGSACWDSAGGVSGSGFGLCGSQNFGFANPTFTNQTATGFDFTGTFSVTNGESTVLFATLQADCQNGALCDFSHTGSFSLGLPSGGSFTSDSGVLFTQQISGVPEPSADALLLTAMLGLGLAARRRFSLKQLKND